MRIVKLDKTTEKDIQSNLLKRSPNQYDEYQDLVNDILKDVKSRKDQSIFEYNKQE